MKRKALLAYLTENGCQLLREGGRHSGEKKVPGKLFFSNGRGNPAPTLTRSVYAACATIKGLFIIVKVGARSPRPLFIGIISNNL